MSAAGPALGGRAWRRCAHPAAAVVAFGLLHLLAGTGCGCCEHHATQVGGEPGAVLTGAVDRVPVQPALPGLDRAAGPTASAGGPPPRGGRR